MSGGPLVGVVHGPNLDRLGRREPEHYGTSTLGEIDDALRARADREGARVVSFQSNAEGALIDWIRERSEEVDGWLVNAAGLTHTSVALRDALVASGAPFVEVHLSNPFGREAFRSRSYLADVAVGLVCGFRARSYELALEGLLARISDDG